MMTSKHFVKFGPNRLLNDKGKCPRCGINALLMKVDEFGWHGTICKNCGYERLPTSKGSTTQ